MQKLQTVLQAIASELPGFSAAGIVLIEDGITVAALGKGPETDPSAIAAYLTGIVQSKIKAAPFVGEQPSVEDILIARDDRYYFIRLAPKDLTSFLSWPSAMSGRARSGWSWKPTSRASPTK